MNTLSVLFIFLLIPPCLHPFGCKVVHIRRISQSLEQMSSENFDKYMEAIFGKPSDDPPVMRKSDFRCSACLWAYADTVYYRCGHMRMSN